MPHFKADIIEVARFLNERLNDPSQVDELAGLNGFSEVCDVCAGAGLRDSAVEGLRRIRPEYQDLFVSSLEIAAKNKRPMYVTWRAGFDQELNIRVPADSGLPMCVEFVSRFTEDSF